MYSSNIVQKNSLGIQRSETYTSLSSAPTIVNSVHVHVFRRDLKSQVYQESFCMKLGKERRKRCIRKSSISRHTMLHVGEEFREPARTKVVAFSTPCLGSISELKKQKHSHS